MSRVLEFSQINSLLLYMIVFIIVSLIIGLDKENIHKRFTLLSYIGLAILILIAMIRYKVGTDYSNYERAMNMQANISLIHYLQENGMNEIGNFFTNKLGYLVGSYKIVLAIRAALTVITIYIAIWNHKEKSNIAISMFLFMCIYYPFSLNISTQFIAIGILAIGYKYIIERNIFKYISCIIVASLFHTSALLMFPIYFIWNNKNTLKNKIIIAVFVVLSVIIVKNSNAVIDLISCIDGFESYSKYSKTTIQGKNRDIYVKLLLFIIVYLFRKPLIKHDDRNKLYILLILLNLIIGFSGNISPYIKRIGLYLEITQVFILPSFIKIVKNKCEKNLIGLYGIGYFTLVYYILGQSHVIPYRIMM